MLRRRDKLSHVTRNSERTHVRCTKRWISARAARDIIASMNRASLEGLKITHSAVSLKQANHEIRELINYRPRRICVS